MARLIIPASERDSTLRHWRKATRRTADTTTERARPEHRHARLQEVYLDGDLDRASYRRQKADLTAQLAAFPVGGQDDAIGQQLGEFLTEVASAWQVATPEVRTRLARQLLRGAIIENKTVVAVVPRPELAPFFDLVA